MTHMLPKIAVILFIALLLSGSFWFLVIESFLTRNSDYPRAERLEGVQKVLTVIPIGRDSLLGFRFLEGEGDGEKEVALFSDKWNTHIEHDLKHSFDYRGAQYHFFHRPSGIFEVYRDAFLLGRIHTAGLWRSRKRIEGHPGSWSMDYPEKWSPDIDISENGVLVAKITFEHFLHQKRPRKVCFFGNLGADKEVFIAMAAATCRPKFGNLTRG